jgi:hypothetical protein
MKKGDVLYQDLIMRSTFFLNKFPGSKIVAVLWQQGESDVGDKNYRSNLDAMIINMRKDLDRKELPFFLGGMVPFWVKQSAQRVKQQEIIKNTEKRLNNCYYVDPDGIGKPDNSKDSIHFSHENQMELAKRYWQCYKKKTPSIIKGQSLCL